MKGFRKLNSIEIQTLHHEISDFVDSHWVNDRNPDIRIQTFGECDVGLECLTCGLLDVKQLRIGDAKAGLQSRWPDADVYYEDSPTGGGYFKLEVPLWVPNTRSGGGGGGTYKKDFNMGGPPSPVLGMFLLMGDVLSLTVLYFLTLR